MLPELSIAEEADLLVRKIRARRFIHKAKRGAAYRKPAPSPGQIAYIMAQLREFYHRRCFEGNQFTPLRHVHISWSLMQRLTGFRAEDLKAGMLGQNRFYLLVGDRSFGQPSTIEPEAIAFVGDTWDKEDFDFYPCLRTAPFINAIRPTRTI